MAKFLIYSSPFSIFLCRVFWLNNCIKWFVFSSLYHIFLCWLLLIFLPFPEIILEKRLGFPQEVAMNWQGTSTFPSSCIVKKILRLEIPVDAYPNVCIFYSHTFHGVVLWSVIHFFMWHIVQFHRAPSWTQGQFVKKSWSINWMSCLR